MIDFMILYEIPVRELDNILILGSELKRRGYSVEYMNIRTVSKLNCSQNYRMLKRYRNNVKTLLVPSFYHDNEMLDYFYYPFGKVSQIVNFRWEQYYVNAVMEHPEDNLYLYPCESGKQAYHVCWGELSHRNMIAAGIAEDRLLDTGPLHMDILRDSFREYFLKKDELFRKYGLDSEKKTVLFISSFANATDKSKYHQYLQKFFSGNYKIDYSRIELEHASYDKALKWFNDFVDVHEDVNFIYRPHPSEQMTEEIRAIAAKHPNFRIISEHSVKQWILSCETIVTWMSTAIIEAYFANKPCFIIRPVQFPLEKDMCIYKGAEFITNESKFLEITDAVCENSLSNAYVQKCYDVQSRPSYARLCDELERIRTEPEVFPWDGRLTGRIDRERSVLAVKYYCAVAISLFKKIVFAFLTFIQSKTGLSFGKKLDGKIEARKKNGRANHAGDALRRQEEILGNLVRKQEEGSIGLS